MRVLRSHNFAIDQDTAGIAAAFAVFELPSDVMAFPGQLSPAAVLRRILLDPLAFFRDELPEAAFGLACHVDMSLKTGLLRTQRNPAARYDVGEIESVDRRCRRVDVRRPGSAGCFPAPPPPLEDGYWTAGAIPLPRGFNRPEAKPVRCHDRVIRQVGCHKGHLQIGMIRFHEAARRVAPSARLRPPHPERSGDHTGRGGAAGRLM